MTEEKTVEKPVETPTKEAKTKKNVNYVYGALLLHSAGKKIDESGMKKVIEATGVSADAAQIKALTSSLDGVDIDDAIAQSAMVAVAPAAPADAAPAAGKKEEVNEKAGEKRAEEAAAGLGSLFG